MAGIDAHKVEQQLRHASELGQLVIVRAQKLMAYGVNASYSKDADYNLPGFIRYEDDLEPLKDDLRLSFQEMFRSWVVGNGLRDMLEGLAITLDGLYSILMQVRGAKEGRNEKPLAKQIKAFTKRGMIEKLSDLKRDFDIEIDTKAHMSTITKARNCLTHRFGYVGEHDCDGEQKHITITWRSFDMIVNKSDGSAVSVTRDRVAPIPYKKNEPIDYGFKTGMLRVALGEEIIIPARALEEISVMMRFSSGKLYQQTANWLIDYGVLVHKGIKVEDPTISMEMTLSEP